MKTHVGAGVPTAQHPESVDPDRKQKQRHPAGDRGDGTRFHRRHGTTPVFGLREDSESMHHHLKMMLPN